MKRHVYVLKRLTIALPMCMGMPAVSTDCRLLFCMHYNFYALRMFM